AFNLDNSTAPYPARTPVTVPAGQTTPVYLNIDGGLPAGSTVKWFSSSGTLDANNLAPQLGPIDATSGSYSGHRDVTLSGAYTYVRAAVYDPAGKLYANTQPIFFRPSGGGGGGGGGGGTLPPFTATADAYVVQTAPTTSYGTSPKLRVDSDPTTNSYLRFNVQGVAGTVTGVQLKIYATSSLTAGFTVNSVTDGSWTDTGATAIRWNTAPQIGPKIIASPAAVANSYVTVNLPASTVTGNGDVNFALTPNSTTALSLASKDDTDPTHWPQLIVTTS
ncbi:MAG: CBM96 family carbohydrate-binding protein, partial [Gaiellaceae bacterium]